VGLLSLVTTAGCQDSAKPGDSVASPEDPSEPVDHLVAGPERDVQLIARTAVLGFRAEGAELRAGYATHDATVRDGVAELTPYHHAANGERIAGGKLGVETGAITREDGTVLGGSSVTRTNSAGAVEITRGAAVEVLTNREDGIQQEWKFAQAPAGTGDLTVEVQVSGQAFVRQTDSGLHFKSSAGLGFRYSHALWLDAAGKEWPIQVAWQDDHIAITVPADILAESTFPATLDPTITPEVDVDAAVNGATGAHSRTPAVASDGTNYLVVWSDERLDRDADIFATRVSAAGAILSTVGIAVGTTAGRQLNPAVAFAGNQFVVVWEDFKISGGVEADIAGARISTTGVVTPLGRIAPSAQNELGPKIVGNGNNALVTWDNGGDIRASLFNGAAFGGAISITSDAAVQSGPAITAQPGGNYLIAYSEGAVATADLRGALVTPGGVRSGAAFTISAGAGRQFDPAAAFDGTNYVVTWTNNNLGVNLFGARVSTARVVLDTRTEGLTANVGGISISSVPNSNQEASSLSCVPGACVVAWQESRNLETTSFDIYSQRLSVSPALANNGPEILVSTANRPQFAPALATNGADFFAAWQDDRDANVNTVFGARLTAAGAVTDGNGLMLVTGNNRENTPAVGRAGKIFGVFWSDSRSFGTDIELVRFTEVGTKLDATARAISNAVFSQASPAVTSSAGDYLVVWNDARNGIDRDIFAARVTATAVVRDPTGIPITTATGDQLVPDIATNGTVSLVAWQDRRNGNFDIFAALIDNVTGAVTSSDILVCNAAGDQGRPRVAFDASSNQFLVVWSDGRVNDDVDVFGARVSIAGAVLDPNGVVIASAPNIQGAPRATFLGNTGLVVWEDRRLDGQGDIFGGRVRLGAGGITVLDADGFSISGTAAGSQDQPTVSTLKGSFLVAWTDGRNINTSGTDIFAQQIGTNASLNGAEFAVAAGPGNEDAPSLTDVTTNSARIAYTRLRSDLQTSRVATRSIVTSGGTGQACSNNTQCSTGFCVDSRCCDTACGGNNKTDCQSCSIRATGVADGTCAFVVPTTICRNYASPICDLRENCTGTSAECPADVGRREGQVCNSTTGDVCPSNAAPGPHGCP
jgi:hypothetical protein